MTSAQLSFKTFCVFPLSCLGSATHLFVLLGPPFQFFGSLYIRLRLISPGTGNARLWVEHGAGKGSIPKRSWKRRAQLSATGLLDRTETGNGSGCHATPRPLSVQTHRNWTDPPKPRIDQSTVGPRKAGSGSPDRCRPVSARSPPRPRCRSISTCKNWGDTITYTMTV